MYSFGIPLDRVHNRATYWCLVSFGNKCLHVLWYTVILVAYTHSMLFMYSNRLCPFLFFQLILEFAPGGDDRVFVGGHEVQSVPGVCCIGYTKRNLPYLQLRSLTCKRNGCAQTATLHNEMKNNYDPHPVAVKMKTVMDTTPQMCLYYEQAALSSHKVPLFVKGRLILIMKIIYFIWKIA